MDLLPLRQPLRLPRGALAGEHPKPYILNSQPGTRNIEPETLDPKLQTLNPNLDTLNHKP